MGLKFQRYLNKMAVNYGIDISNRDINPKWSNINKDFENLTNKSEKNNINPTSIRVNTMTLVTYLKKTTIELEPLMEYLNKIAPNTASFPKKRSSNKVNNKLPNKQFYNSVSWKIYVKDGDYIFKVSSMFFPNGRIKFAGCKTLRCCSILPQLLISEVLNDVLTGDKIIERSGIEMVNSDYHIFNRETTSLIKQSVLQSIIRDNFMIKNNGQIKSAEYNPDKYPAVNIKFRPLESSIDSSKDITICVFNPGSVIVTGKKDFKHIKEGYDYINNIINNYHKDIIYLRPDFQKVTNRAGKKMITSFNSLLIQ